MAIVELPESDRLRTQLDMGLDDMGRPVTSYRTLNVKPDASNEAVHASGVAVYGLGTNLILKFQRVKTVELIDDGM